MRQCKTARREEGMSCRETGGGRKQMKGCRKKSREEGGSRKDMRKTGVKERECVRLEEIGRGG